MKTLFITFISLFFGTISNPSLEQITVAVTYNGYEDGAYMFTTITTDEEEYEDSFYFEDIPEEIATKLNLQAQDTVGKKFTLTYKSETIIEDGEEYETYSFISLSPLSSN